VAGERRLRRMELPASAGRPKPWADPKLSRKEGGLENIRELGSSDLKDFGV
jgi:hypothetical protein